MERHSEHLSHAQTANVGHGTWLQFHFCSSRSHSGFAAACPCSEHLSNNHKHSLCWILLLTSPKKVVGSGRLDCQLVGPTGSSRQSLPVVFFIISWLQPPVWPGVPWSTTARTVAFELRSISKAVSLQHDALACAAARVTSFTGQSDGSSISGIRTL